MITELQIKNILDAGGMLGSWTDFEGNTQPAPVVRLIRAPRDIDADIGNNRMLLIREVGTSGGDQFGQKHIVNLFLFGLQEDSDTPVVKDRADQLMSFFLEHREGECIITVNAQSFGLPVNVSDTGRPFCEITLETLVDRGFK